MANYFWFAAGALASLCAVIVASPLLRVARESAKSRTVQLGFAAVGIVGFIAAAFLVYQLLGTPEAIGASHVTTATTPHPGTPASSASGNQSMETVVANLEARLARDGGKREDWLLLAQSYDYLGRAADAQHAREKADSAGKGSVAGTVTAAATPPPLGAAATQAPNDTTLSPAAEAAVFEKRVQAKPTDADSWQMLSAIYRRQHDYAHARDAFAHLIQLKRMDADAWADYADVLASLNAGSLRGPPAQAIESALRLQPQHAKALWLKATFAYEEHRYSEALTVWRQLRAALPPDSSDVRIVDANIAEALQLSGQGAASVSSSAAPIAAATVVGSSEVTGTVSIDSRFASRVPPGATLFIYAKDADSPGPPLAVLRQVAGTWPVAFRLDDTLAMIPSRKLSQSEHVIVEARISKSGQAAPAAGDLYVTSAVLNRSQRQKLALVISQEVG